MKSIITNVLKSRRFNIIGFSAGSSAYIILVTSVYKNYLTTNTHGLGQSIQQLPSTLRSFISIKGDFTSPVGFLSSEPYYVILPIVLIILSIVLGSSLLAREEQNHTLELILARPVSRGRLLAGKAAGGFVVLLAVNTVAALAMIIFTRAFGIDISVAALVKVHVMLFLLALIFGALALALAAAGRAAQRTGTAVAALLALGGYILTSLEGTVTWLRWPAKLLPYHYFDPSDILSGNFPWRAALGFIIVIVILGVFAWASFRRRDIE